MTHKRALAILLLAVTIFSISSSAFAFSLGLRGLKVYGGTAGTTFLSGSSRERSDSLYMVYYSDSNFNGNSNFTFRAYEVGGSERASYAISFYPYDANGTWRTGNFFAQASYTLDMRGTVSSSSSASYGYFYGYVQI